MCMSKSEKNVCVCIKSENYQKWGEGFPSGPVVKNPSGNAGNTGEDSTCCKATEPVHHNY